MEKGYKFLPNLLSLDEVKMLIERLEMYESEKEKYKDILEFQYEHDQTHVRKMRRLAWVEPEVWSVLWKKAPVQKLIEKWVGEKAKAAFCAAFLKPKKIGSRTPFHQDQALWSKELPKAFSCWFALDETNEENGCIMLSPESHKLGALPHKPPNDTFHTEVVSEVLRKLPLKSFPMKPGSGLAWDRYMVHGSKENLSEKNRKGVVVVFAPARFLSDDDPLAWPL